MCSLTMNTMAEVNHNYEKTSRQLVCVALNSCEVMLAQMLANTYIEASRDRTSWGHEIERLRNDREQMAETD